MGTRRGRTSSKFPGLLMSRMSQRERWLTGVWKTRNRAVREILAGGGRVCEMFGVWVCQYVSVCAYVCE